MKASSWDGLSDLLSSLEDLELPLLSWGVVDGFLSETDVSATINKQLDADSVQRSGEIPLDEQAYLDRLLADGLLHKIPGTTPRYRTRLAETLRLLRTLRQLWPGREEDPGWWRHHNTLVSDYRIKVSPRRYPNRDTTPDAAIQQLASVHNWSDLKADILRRIFGSRKLATFQVEAARSILTALNDPQPSAAIVTAGTGSGKTLSFYLPALMDIAASSATKNKGPHTLALYPRNELLRDQAREAARTAGELGPLNGPQSRPARIGLLYGSTPRSRDLAGSKDTRKWRKVPSGWITPYFPCLDDKCGGDLLWSDADRIADVERLTCLSCSAQTLPGTLALTRESLKANPPDILFSSTEMLSKQATSWEMATLLGWNGANGIRLVLLDEVHTYSGIHGAQVALMLRRWRYAVRRNGNAHPVMVGLSATLLDAGDFMATMTGVERARVDTISPQTKDLLPISREYGLVLRGDPVSGSSLLSTTIQTGMLLARVLDNKPGMYGSVMFAFADDLDVANRMHDNLRDAEGHDKYGMARGRVLADLRSPDHGQADARYREGQSWDLPAKLGRMDQLRIGRTSSQDAGVDSSADIIVATASLEVGINDPRVGAVIQHKAPRDMASFLQRRGRAGRDLKMRPLTAVVLSDYGRDRITYQSYEKLLDPEIDARSLPIGNRFVVKIQATHALLDWIGRRGVDARWVLSAPYPGGNPHSKTSDVAYLLARLLADADLQRELALHLQRSLQITEDEASAAMWEEPRSLLFSVVPTALRRLESRWKPLDEQSDPGDQPGQVLPEFMTGALFDPLNTPDVTFSLPFNMKDDPPTMGISQALRFAVPGRVSRRYGYARSDHSTWLPVPESGEELVLTEIVAKGHNLGKWKSSDGKDYLVVRPLVIKLAKPPKEVAVTSNAQPVWRSNFEYAEETLHDVDIPKPSVWSDLLDHCAFALHVTGGPIRVQRMAIGSEGELREKKGAKFVSRPVSVRYSHQGEPAAIGFEIDVDGFVLIGDLNKFDTQTLTSFAASAEWRTAAFKQMVLEDERLDGVANVFQRTWLVEVYRHAHVSYGLGGAAMADAPVKLANGHWADSMGEFLAAAYRSEEGELDGDRLVTGLRELVADQMVRTVIEQHGRLLVAPDPRPATAGLLDRVLADTLGSAVMTAVQECVPDAQEGDLVLDIELDQVTRQFKIIVTETSIGGLGLLEALHRDYALDPRIFWDAVGRACEPSDAEDADEAMRELIADLVRKDSRFGPAVRSFREADGIKSMDAALENLVGQWTEHDGPPPHLLVSTFAARLLRPGSKPAIDQILADMASSWINLEQALGVEIDARMLTFHAARGALGYDIAPLTPDMAFSLLWLRGAPARAQRLQHWNPYRDNILVERLCLAGALAQGRAVIDVTTSGWRQEYIAAMEDSGLATLEAPYRMRESISSAIREAIVTPVDRGGLRVFGRVTAVHQRRGAVFAELSLAEELQ